MDIQILDGEYWWAADVIRGHEMPVSRHSDFSFDLSNPGYGDGAQFAPLILSSKGRYVWSENSFSGRVQGEILTLTGEELELEEGFDNLRGAYLAAMRKHFPPSGKLPDLMFWQTPQYNTWMEMGRAQTTENILRYAESIVSHGLPPGILMLDGGWQEEYGVWEFHPGKIPDPRALMDRLHEMGFRVMIWVAPIVAAAGPEFLKLSAKQYLVRNADGTPAIRRWWSGYSAVLDLSNPDAADYFMRQLDSLCERFGVDGFKFDAGDAFFYRDDDCIHTPMPAIGQTAMFNRIGLHYPLNEFRAAWKFGGQPIVARMHDRSHSWDRFGLNTLIPHTLLQGLSGYAFGCPDMVGGGSLGSIEKKGAPDEELFIRWTQANALMGMMQISAAPWRLLSEENLRRFKDALKLREKFTPLLLKLVQENSESGEPIVRHMDYCFPGMGYECENQQFMLGDTVLVSPVLKKGEQLHNVLLPPGEWIGFDGKTYTGPQTLPIPVTEDDLPYFIKK